MALLAVFVGPTISAGMAKKQIAAHIRQEWINTLRKLIAEICSRSTDYRYIGAESRLDLELRKIFALSIEIELFLNASEPNQKILLDEIQTMVMLVKENLPSDESKYWKARNKVMSLTKLVLTSDWEHGGA